MKRLVKHLELLAPIDEHTGQCPVEVVAPVDPGRLQRFERTEHFMRTDRKAGSAQQARKVHHVLGQLA